MNIKQVFKFLAMVTVILANSPSGAAADELLLQNVPAGLDTNLSELRAKFSVSQTRNLLGTSAQVWNVPEAEKEELIKQLQLTGARTLEIPTDYRDIFFSSPPVTDLNEKQKALISNAQKSKSTKNLEVFDLAPSNIINFALTQGFNKRDGMNNDNSIKISIKKNETITATNKSVKITDNGFVWRGVVEEFPGEVTLISNGNNLNGSIVSEGVIYSIQSLGGGRHIVIEKSTADLPPEHPPLKKSPAGLKRQPADHTQKDSANKSVNINVLVAYTPSASANYSNITDDLVKLAIEETNQSFTDSLIGHIQISLAGSVRVAYSESSNWDDHLEQLVLPNDGSMDEIHQQRIQYKADVVVLVIDDDRWCGEAREIGVPAQEAFAIVHHSCATGYYSFGHEIGHLLGARHDECVDNDDAPYKFGHGYLNGTKWRTIMGYGNCCSRCTRRPYWSNPKLIVDGETAGTQARNNNAKVWDLEAEAVSSFY